MSHDCEVITNASKPVAFRIEGALNLGKKIPPTLGIETHAANPDHVGIVRAITSVKCRPEMLISKTDPGELVMTLESYDMLSP